MEILNLSAYEQPVPPGYTGIVQRPNRKIWYKEGKLHRADSPAIEWADGSKAWWFEGKPHRLDGPAWEGANGSKEWWLLYYNRITKETAILLVIG